MKKKTEATLRAVVAFRDEDCALVLQAEGTPDFQELCYTDSDFTNNLIGTDPGMRPGYGVWVWEGDYLGDDGSAAVASGLAPKVKVRGMWRNLTKGEADCLQVGLGAWKRPETPDWVDVNAILISHADYYQHPRYLGRVLIQEMHQQKRMHCLCYLDFEDVPYNSLTPSFVEGMIDQIKTLPDAKEKICRLGSLQVITDQDDQRVMIMDVIDTAIKRLDRQ